MEEQERRAREERRVARLIELADRWRSAMNLREFLGELERTGSHVDGVADLIAWGMATAECLDPLSEPTDVAKALVAERAQDGDR